MGAYEELTAPYWPERDPRLSPLLAAAERLWKSIQRRAGEVPGAVISCSAAAERGQLRKLGHWAAGRWLDSSGHKFGEVHVSAEGLNRGAAEVAETLIHEAAHALNWSRGISDTSQEGRYHNRHYMAAAEELGLRVSKMAGFGFALTTLPEETAAAYGEDITRLAGVLAVTRDLDLRTRVPKRDKNLQLAMCGCGRKIRAAKGELAEPDIVCGRCESPFYPLTKGEGV